MTRYRPLASELLRQLVLVAAVPVVITAIFFIWQLYPQLKQDVANEQQALALVIAEQSSQYIDTAEEQVQYFIKTINQSTGQTLSADIDNFVQSSSYFDTLYMLDYFGTISHIGIRGAQKEIIDTLYVGLDISQSQLYRNPDKLIRNSWSGVFLSVVTGRVSIAYIKPLDNQTLVAELAIDRLPHISQRLSKNGLLVMILDEQAQLIAHPDSETNQQYVNVSNLPFFNTLERKDIQSEYFEMDAKRYFGTLVRMKEPSWQVIVAQDEALFSARLYNILNNWLLSMFAVVVIALVLAHRRSQKFSKRFKELNKHAAQVAKGNYTHPPAEVDITELKQLSDSLISMAEAIRRREQTLQTREAQLRNTLESAPNVAVQWYDERGQVGYWNEASERIFGFSQDEALGKRLDKLIFAPRQTAEFNILLQHVAQGDDKSLEFELPFNHKSGREGHMRGAIFSIPSAEGKELYVCMSTDVTKQRQAEANIRRLNAELEHNVEQRTEALKRSNLELESTLATLKETMEQLVQSEKLAGLGSLVAGIAHELNTPIGNALMAASSLNDFAEEINDQFEQDEMKRSHFERFLADARSATGISARNLERAAELISSFKQVAVDQSSSQRRQFFLTELVHEILLTLHPQTKKMPIRIQEQIPANIELDSYPGPLGQVLSNLTMNAINHAFEGKPDATLVISAKLVNTNIHITIRDNGIGIPDNLLPRIFDPFFTTKLGQGGCGLGLNIVHNLVHEILGGQVQVKSQVGRGTSFVLILPVKAPQLKGTAMTGS